MKLSNFINYEINSQFFFYSIVHHSSIDLSSDLTVRIFNVIILLILLSF